MAAVSTVQRSTLINHSSALSAAAVACLSCSAWAQPVPNYDFSWATIGDTGNAPYPGGPTSGNAGRGGVDYAYRISKLEISTSQWVNYLNTVSPLFPGIPNFGRPGIWGAQNDPAYPGPGSRYILDPNVPNAGQVPVYGIGWRDAARYCNWLHNGKAATVAAVSSGAYDTSTFTTAPNGWLNDQRTHSPGALFWIPTLDEWLKAAHYDPDRHGPGQGGWWQGPYRSDLPPVPGLPGVGQTSAGLDLPLSGEFFIPLGSYPQSHSAYGLFDLSGAVSEWLEDAPDLDGLARLLDGAQAGRTLTNDRADVTSNAPVLLFSLSGFRVASAVPAPGSLVVIVALGVLSARRRR